MEVLEKNKVRAMWPVAEASRENECPDSATYQPCKNTQYGILPVEVFEAGSGPCGGSYYNRRVIKTIMLLLRGTLVNWTYLWCT